MPNSRSKLEQAAWLAVVQAYQVCTRQYTRMLSEFDLTVAQFDAMTRIEELGARQARVTPHEIAEAMLVTRGNLTGLLRRLQERTLVVTRPHPEDGRSVICTLTPHGRALLEKAKVASASFIQKQLAPFATAALEHTRSQMTEMAAHLETLDPQSIASVAAQREAIAS
ncbi:MAG: MarR family transcriptional regulator [Pseudomonadota bacterium]